LRLRDCRRRHRKSPWFFIAGTYGNHNKKPHGEAREESMKARCFTLTVAIIALAISLGCAGKQDQTETMLDTHWGSSFESAKYNQLLNPDAGKNLDPVVGLDGEAAGKTMERYKEGYKAKSSTSVNLGIIGGRQ
jgi:hypothetical protein